MLLEACLDSLDLARKAELGGAGRIELCDRLDVGGTTPSRDFIESVIAAVSIPVFPIIRPRGGDFVHTDAEIDSMKRDVEMAATAGASGIVLGVLQRDGSVDAERTKSVMDVAPHLPATFHLAFDRAADQDAALETLVEIGMSRVLTSGGAGKALDGAGRLAHLVRLARGRLVILAGGSIREDNAAEIVRRSGVSEIHSKGTNVAAIIRAANIGEAGAGVAAR